MQSSGEYIKKVAAIYTVLLLGQVVLFIIALLEIQPSMRNQIKVDSFVWEVVLFTVLFVLSYILFHRYLKRAKLRRGIREKLILYKKALFIQWFVIVIVSVATIVLYLLSEMSVYLYINVFSIVVFILNRPGIDRTCNDLDMDKNEESVLRTPNAAL